MASPWFKAKEIEPIEPGNTIVSMFGRKSEPARANDNEGLVLGGSGKPVSFENLADLEHAEKKAISDIRIQRNELIQETERQHKYLDEQEDERMDRLQKLQSLINDHIQTVFPHKQLVDAPEASPPAVPDVVLPTKTPMEEIE